jgi:hypothetical protein
MKLSLNEALLIKANYLCFAELVKIIIKFLKKKTKEKHVLKVKAFCLFYSFRNMSHWCLQYINSHFTSVSKEREFLSLTSVNSKVCFWMRLLTLRLKKPGELLSDLERIST